MSLRDCALWVGWAVLAVGGVLAVLGVLVFVPYAALSVYWRYVRTQDDFIRIAMVYMKEKRRKERSIMGTPE